MPHFNWTPGIGDPTIGGWVTVVLYLLAAGSCWISAQKLGLGDIGSNERSAWRAISVLFLALGINKQLDLQTALTEAGRVLAQYEGWYEQRLVVQLAFIALVAIICLIAAITLLLWTRRAPIPTRLALIGTTIVLGFVVIRAASFHHVDQFIGQKILGLRWNWVLEMGGISLVLFASQWRQVGIAKSVSRSVRTRMHRREAGGRGGLDKMTGGATATKKTWRLVELAGCWWAYEGELLPPPEAFTTHRRPRHLPILGPFPTRAMAKAQLLRHLSRREPEGRHADPSARGVLRRVR